MRVVAAVHEVLARLNFERDTALLTPRFLESRAWQVNQASFPLIDVTFGGTRPLRASLDCADWDESPPAAVLLDPSGVPLSGSVPGGVFHPGPHPS